MAKIKTRKRPLKNTLPLCVYIDKVLMDIVIVYQDKSVCRVPINRVSKEFSPRN